MIDLDSLFKLSYGMYLLCSKTDDKYAGCLVNSVFQLTPEPPMVAVSVCRTNLTSDYITASKVFSVSVLAEQSSEHLMGSFGFRSSRDIDKFKDVKHDIGQTGCPIVLDDAIAFLEAEVKSYTDIETHRIFFAEIVSCETLDGQSHPMTYSYYRDVKHGKTPRSAATYHESSDQTVNQNQNKNKDKDKKGDKKMAAKYVCDVCGYEYDPAVGDPDNGVAVGTAFADLPDGWVCPVCGVGVDEFSPVE